MNNTDDGNELIAAFDESRGHFVMVNKEDAVWDDAIREYVVTRRIESFCPVCGGSGGAIGNGTEFPCHSSNFEPELK